MNFIEKTLVNQNYIKLPNYKVIELIYIKSNKRLEKLYSNSKNNELDKIYI